MLKNFIKLSYFNQAFRLAKSNPLLKMQENKAELVHDDSAEVIQIVDINNNPIGPATRQEMREKHLIHRCSFIFLENAATHKLYVHKRTMLKKWCPGFWDLLFGGVVQYQETYEENAQRELLEEAGVDDKMVPLFEFLFNQQPSVPTWGKVFYARTNKTLKLQPEEVEEVVEMSIEEIKEKIEKETNYAYDSVAAFKLFMEKYEEYKQIIDKELSQ